MFYPETLKITLEVLGLLKILYDMQKLKLFLGAEDY